MELYTLTVYLLLNLADGSYYAQAKPLEHDLTKEACHQILESNAHLGAECNLQYKEVNYQVEFYDGTYQIVSREMLRTLQRNNVHIASYSRISD